MPRLIKTILLVLVAAVGAVVFRALFVAASKPRAPRPPVTAQVRVAAAELPEGLLLRESDLAWKDVPRSQIPPGALVKAESRDGKDSDLKGDVLRHAARAGAPLGASDVISPDAPGFLAAALKPGMRATSVAIDDVSGNAGLIQPGDYVDVLLTQQLGGSSSSLNSLREVEAETVVSHVRILAVGSAFQRPKDDAAEPKTRARTVTFEVTPHTAEVIAVATHLGSLSLALRSFATSDRNAPVATSETLPESPPVWATDVSRALRAAPPERLRTARAATAAPERRVIVYRGSQVSTTSSDSRQSESAATSGRPADPTPVSARPPAQLAAQASSQH
ncbi:Flp pilus assembly protein CpaB [Paraburkholderia mimosarum]|uniref:Flp pilus assembly protein CpaB n=1 Tax=Paraburkholderia mimosarum TaxID=312026 RepID=UPI0039C45ED9